MTFTATFDTGLHADCVRFIPNLPEKEEIAVFSCYELDENTNKRLGKFILAERTGNEVNVIQTIDTCGVFEFNWFQQSNVLVSALAEGPPAFFKYEDRKLKLLPVDCEDGNDLEMTLAVAGDPDRFLSCDNKGNLHQWTLRESNLLLDRSWNAHDAEIWYVSQDVHNKNLFYTGSDDYSMKIWDLRCESAVAVNKSGHEAGVCCIAGSPWDEFVIATGSYDERVRLWDRRAMRNGPLKSVECGSGAWRVVWNPQNCNEMAVAAMRAGFHILNLESNQIIQSELVSDHVAYGIDWHSNGKSLASCSFYNNQGQFFTTF